jgi:CBS domain-containing protein
VTEVDMTIDALPLAQPLRVAQSTTLREVASIMEDMRLSCVLVGPGRHLVTEHDLAGGLAAGLMADSSVDQVATRMPIWATSSSTLLDAIEMMVKHGIRHLLVLAADGTALGVLSLSTATEALLNVTTPLDTWPGD